MIIWNEPRKGYYRFGQTEQHSMVYGEITPDVRRGLKIPDDEQRLCFWAIKRIPPPKEKDPLVQTREGHIEYMNSLIVARGYCDTLEECYEACEKTIKELEPEDATT